MARDYYAEGYQQAAQDFAQGKGYKPHKLRNLLMLVKASDKQNEAFLKGYRAGYDYCGQLKLQEYARDSLQAWPGGGSAPRILPNRLEELSQMRQSIDQRPEQKPYY